MMSKAEAALAYARAGWAVIPCRGKRPLISRWQLTEANKVDQVAAWWRRGPDRNVAAVMGTSGLLAVDVDRKNGVDGSEALAALEREHGPLPETRKSLTPTGGYHLLFTISGDPPPSAIGKLGPGLDVKCDRGYIMLPPSTVELDGEEKLYAWAPDGEPGIAPAPEWLLELLRVPADKPATPPAEWLEILSHPIVRTTRNATMARLIGRWLRKYCEPYEVLEVARCVNQVRCDPPLTDAELQTVFTSILHKEVMRRHGLE